MVLVLDVLYLVQKLKDYEMLEQCVLPSWIVITFMESLEFLLKVTMMYPLLLDLLLGKDVFM
jgi:hypothetical protein